MCKRNASNPMLFIIKAVNFSIFLNLALRNINFVIEKTLYKSQYRINRFNGKILKLIDSYTSIPYRKATIGRTKKQIRRLSFPQTLIWLQSVIMILYRR